MIEFYYFQLLSLLNLEFYMRQKYLYRAHNYFELRLLKKILVQKMTQKTTFLLKFSQNLLIYFHLKNLMKFKIILQLKF